MAKNNGVEKVTDDQPRVHFDCTKCPAFCCSIYERVAVTKRDITRLAKYFKVTFDSATRRYTKMHDGERVLRRKKDTLFDEACMFLDQETRGCTIYHARPAVCREYPARTRCAYYDVLRFERKQQDDEKVLPLFQITFRDWRPKKVEHKDEMKDGRNGKQTWEWTPEKKR
jgi:Fe-S-cluster containining protein